MKKEKKNNIEKERKKERKKGRCRILKTRKTETYKE